MVKKRNKVLLVGWDAADWKVINPLLDRGEMKYLRGMIESGVMGNLHTLQPVLSPMLWNSIATGKRADKHGILGFTTVDETTGDVRPFGTQDRKVKAAWNILNQEGYRSHVVNWFCGHPPEPLNGTGVSELVPRQTLKMAKLDTIPDLPEAAVYPASFRETVADLRVWPQDIDAQTMRLFVPKLDEVDQSKDPRIFGIAGQLAECLTSHAITTHILENEGWDFVSVYYGELDHFCHGFMKYHPPRMDHIPETDFELYNDVVNSAYRLHDLLLGRLLQLAGEEATVILCSDHGYLSDHLRPTSTLRVPAGPADEHRPLGIFVMSGPGVRQDELVHGANLLDITPTVLRVFDLPVGEDMEGRVLTEAFEEEVETKTIPSWEKLEGEDGMLDSSATLSADDTEALLKQFEELGYIDPLAGNREQDVAVTRSETEWNLARVYLSTSRYIDALPLLEKVYRAFPLRLDVGTRLVDTLLALGLTDEAKEMGTNLAQAYPGRSWVRIMLGRIELQLRNPAGALEIFESLLNERHPTPALYQHIGSSLLQLYRMERAREAYEKALALNPDSHIARFGLAQCSYRERDYTRAANDALQALGLEFVMPRAHILLGMALGRQGDLDGSVRAFETCLRFQPGNLYALRLLAAVYRAAGETDKAKKVATCVRSGIEKRRARRNEVELLRRKLARRKMEWGAARVEEENDLAQAILEEDARPKPPPLAQRTGAIKAGSSGKEFVIVSGLPRSGTSLMMQILSTGGLPPMTDGERAADEDNPEGYFEWEAVKNLHKSPHLIEEAAGKALKVISLLLAHLPPVHRYKIIFMDRQVEEVAASQAKMINHRGGKAPEGGEEKTRAFLEKHRQSVLEKLDAAGHVELLKVDYPALVEDPDDALEQVVEFLGRERLPAFNRMAEAIKPCLYRNKAGPS